CGLRCGARALPLENGIVVGIATFAPAAVLVLDALQPAAGFLQPRLAHVESERVQTTQNLPGSVNVIHTPAAVPRAVFFLVLANEFEGLLQLRMIGTIALVTE